MKSVYHEALKKEKREELKKNIAMGCFMFLFWLIRIAIFFGLIWCIVKFVLYIINN